jgi:hypothetical protein
MNGRTNTIATHRELRRAFSEVNLETAISSGAALEAARESGLINLAPPEAPLEELAATPPAAEQPATPMDLARFQAALGRAVDLLEEETTEAEVMTSAQHQVASILQGFLDEYGNETNHLDEVAPGVLEAKFDTRDILGWVGSVFNYWRRLVPHRFIPPPETADPISNDARLAMLGDWGTGLYGAPESAKTIAAGHWDVLVHLGDVYYAGMPKEMKRRFLDLWPRVDGAVTRLCNANHEMYSGGIAYFRDALPMFGQRSSCWALQNDHWLLVGLDSAYADNDLHGDQVRWLARLLDSYPDRKVVLFCHHQPFSLLSGQGQRLVAKLGPTLESRRIHAWYWGHEHRCVLYDRHEGWQMYGRCVGHGGMPQFRDRGDTLQEPGWWTHGSTSNAPGAQILGGPNRYIERHGHRYSPNGYISLEMRGAMLLETVHAPDGSVLHEMELD